MKHENIILASSNLCGLIIGITGGFITGMTATGPQEPINILILFGSIIVLTWGIIHIILKKS